MAYFKMVGEAQRSRKLKQSARTVGRLGGLGADGGERALWLGGAGHRAALFHLGALTRLNELGLLGRLDAVGAADGGSIVAAALAGGVEWPLRGAYREWPERVAEPLRAVTRRNARARAFLRSPFAAAGEEALAERCARDLLESLGGEPERGPRLLLGAAGLTLAGLVHAQDDRIEWELEESAAAGGYAPELVREAIAPLRTDLDAFGAGEQAVLENHGYLLADAAARQRGLAVRGGIELAPAEPPQPRWMGRERVRRELAGSGRRRPLGRLRPQQPRRGRRRPEAGSAALEKLLERHRPVLQFDSLESFRADSVETICAMAERGRCNSLHRADGTLLAAVEPGDGVPRLQLDFLRAPTYPSGEPVRGDDYLDECGGSHAADALKMRRRPGAADVVYGRAREDEQGRLWLQYFFFHYYDDKGLLGVARHEGDWEMVQLLLGEDGAPVAATLAQHGGAERLAWEELERARVAEGEAALIYPARGSHAPRPRAGSFAAPLLPDHSDGIGARVRPRLVPIADDGPGWLLWPGRWGATRRREAFEGNSPRGPRELPQWWDPAELHREARPWRRAAADRLAPPPRPFLEAHREEGLATVSYRFPYPRREEGEPARLLAAPLASGDVEPCPTHSVPVERLEGSFAVELPSGPAWMGVRVSAASSHGVPGETLALRLGE